MGRGSKPSKDVQLARIKSQQRLVFWDGLFSTMRTAIRGLTAVGCFYAVYLSAEALAGSRTEVVMVALAKMSTDRYVAYCIAALSSAGFFLQRRANKNLAKEKEEYVRELERRLDPRRTSSRLDKEGMPDRGDDDGS